jgi:hypothetical protein
MTPHTDLTTSDPLTTPLECEAWIASPDKPKVRSTASQVVGGAKLFCCYVLAAAIGISVYTLAFEQTNRSTTAADWFLWACGSDKTWEEYQRDHVAKGHPRLKDKEKGWVHQLFHDALSGNND